MLSVHICSLSFVAQLWQRQKANTRSKKRIVKGDSEKFDAVAGEHQNFARRVVITEFSSPSLA